MFVRRRRSQGLSGDDTPAAPRTDSGGAVIRIPGERLPSRISSVFFTACIDGAWRLYEDGQPQEGDHAAVARHQLRERVRRTLAYHSVLDASAAEDDVNADITQWHSPSPGLQIRGSVRLTVEEQEKALAQDHLHKERDSSLEQQETLRRLTFLQRVLSDPDLRRVWWIDSHPDRLGELATVNTELSNLKPPRDPSHDVLRDEVVRFVDQLLSDIHTPQQREIFLHTFSRTLQILGSNQLQSTAARWLDTAMADPGSASA